jgi:tetratricopeptide (TPR) repeat protein
MERYEEARALYDGLLEETTLAETELYNLGVALFRARDPEGAAEAFRRLTEARPDSRDAWFNYANALLAYEAWTRLVEVGTRLLELDPLGESSALIVARAHLESGDEQGALAQLQRLDATPIHLEGLIMRGNGPLTTLSGNVVGNAAEPGTRVGLRFSFYGPDGEAHQETEVVAPETDQRGPLEVTVEFRATAYRYEWVEDAPPGG